MSLICIPRPISIHVGAQRKQSGYKVYRFLQMSHFISSRHPMPFHPAPQLHFPPHPIHPLARPEEGHLLGQRSAGQEKKVTEIIRNHPRCSVLFTPRSVRKYLPHLLSYGYLLLASAAIRFGPAHSVAIPTLLYHIRNSQPPVDLGKPQSPVWNSGEFGRPVPYVCVFPSAGRKLP